MISCKYLILEKISPFFQYLFSHKISIYFDFPIKFCTKNKFKFDLHRMLKILMIFSVNFVPMKCDLHVLHAGVGLSVSGSQNMHSIASFNILLIFPVNFELKINWNVKCIFCMLECNPSVSGSQNLSYIAIFYIHMIFPDYFDLQCIEI